MMWRARVGRYPSRAVMISCVLLVACGGGTADDGGRSSSDPDPTGQSAAEPDAPDRVRLRIALLSEAPGLQQALQEWETTHGVQVDVAIVEDPLDTGTEFSLVEVDAADLGDLAASQRIRELESLGAVAEVYATVETAIYDGRVYGIPWRGRLHGVGLPSPITPGADVASWSALARLCQRLGGLAVVDPIKDAAPWDFLALSVGNGASFQSGESGELRMDPPEAVEAMAFLVRLHGRSKRLGRAEGAVAHVAGGGLSSAPQGEVENWMGWPRPQGGRPLAWVQSRVLCVPRLAPYFELVQQLLEVLSSPRTASRLGESTPGHWQSLHRSRLPDVDPIGLSASQDQRRALMLWSHAAAAVLDRRRSPEAALLEAQESWMTAEQHRP